MAYQSLYRRYRPQRFGEVRGQEPLVRALQNAVRDDRVGHAYLFSGPRGTGKTSTARILAKALNCTSPSDGEPCGTCESCVAIAQGSSFDVHELDAASNNGVEAVRELVAKASLGTPGRTKVYILDEVHMLSTAASNALLKTLEEPPDHVVFVLATTDPQKVLPTIRSRCQHFEVRLLPASELESLVDDVVADAGLEISPAERDLVLRSGAGSARDTLSALDQVAAGGGFVDDDDPLDELVEALCERDTGRALRAVEQATASGRNPRTLGEQLMARLRDVFLASLGMDLARLPEAARERAVEQGSRLGPAGATRALEVVGEAFVGIQDAPDPRVVLEVALVRMTRPDSDLSLSALAERISRLESGAPAPERSGPPGAPPAEAPPAEAEGPSIRPANGARQVLARSRGQEQTSPPPTLPPAPVKPTAAPAPAAGTTTEPAPDTRGGSAALPSKDELTLAWGDVVLSQLPGRARSRFSSGRFLEVDGTKAVFGLPNKIHAAKCEEVRGEVEAALATHFGRPVPLAIVVDTAAAPPGRGGPEARAGAANPAEQPEDPEEIDVSELRDATDVASSGLERLERVFPGARLVEGS